MVIVKTHTYSGNMLSANDELQLSVNISNCDILYLRIEFGQISIFVHILTLLSQTTGIFILNFLGPENLL